MLLKNGLVLESGNLEKRDVLIEKDRIVEISKDIREGNHRVVDVLGCAIVPGAVDVHVHLREPGFTHKETIKTGTLSALKGGVTAVMGMPNTNPVPDSKERAEQIYDMYAKDAMTRAYLYGSVTRGQKGRRLADYRGMKPYVKALSDDGICLSNLRLLKDAMYAAKEEDLIICSHAEAKGYGNSPEAEVRAIEREINLVSKVRCKYHFCHISTLESVKAIRRGQAAGLDITSEVTPHHIFLCKNTMQYTGNFKMSPPLRTFGDMRGTLQGFISGFIDMIATDHAPHTEDEKSTFETSPNGIIGLETLIPLLYTGLVRTGKLTLDKIIEYATYNPAKRFSLPYGMVKEGGLADLAVLDLDNMHEYTKEEILSKSKNSPFIGTQLFGMNKMTLVGGEVKYMSQEFSVRGLFLKG